MRRLTSTLLLVAVLAGLVAYIYFVDAKRDPNAANALPKAFDVEAENIEELELKNASGETVRVRKMDDAWQLVEPVKAEGDDGTIGTIATSLAGLEIQRVVDENPSDLAQYGLSPARLDVGFRLKGEERVRHLLVGEKTPTGGDLYAKLPDENRVFLIASYLDGSLNRTAFDLREKTILKFDRANVNAVEIDGANADFRLARSGSEWRLAEPIAARADYAAAESILTRLSGDMQSVVSEDAQDLGKYGLDKPALTAVVVSGSARATLLLGKSGEDVFGKDSARPMVFAVDPGVLADLDKTIADLRRKDLFDARSFTASRIELRRGDQTTVLEKSTGEGDKEVWRKVAGQEVEAANVADLMTRLGNLRAQSFEAVTHPSLRTPVLAVTVRFDTDKTETVTFGRSNGDAIASRADEPGTAKVDAMQLDEAIKTLDSL